MKIFKKILKIIGLMFLVLVVFGTIFYFYASYSVDQRLSKRYNVTPVDFPVLTDSAAISHGRHLVNIKGCADCHGDDMGGKVIADDIMLGKLAGPNLTKGTGGISMSYKTTDWVLAIRHGLASDGRPLVVMPSLETSQMSQKDLQDMIAYLNTLPPIDREMPENKLVIMIKTMVHIDKIQLIPAEQIDHSAALVSDVDNASPVEFGKYLSAMCSGCHHENFKGGDPMAPGFPPVPDITSTGTTGRWTEAQFMTALRTAKRPDGTVLDPNMPVQMTKHYTDEELHALYSYLKSL